MLRHIISYEQAIKGNPREDVEGGRPTRAVIYACYFSDSQRKESIKGQSQEYTTFAEKNGITILRYFIGWAFSATADKCPEFQNMINSGKKLFDIVIVSGNWTGLPEIVMTALVTRPL